MSQWSDGVDWDMRWDRTAAAAALDDAEGTALGDEDIWPLLEATAVLPHGKPSGYLWWAAVQRAPSWWFGPRCDEATVG